MVGALDAALVAARVALAIGLETRTPVRVAGARARATHHPLAADSGDHLHRRP